MSADHRVFDARLKQIIDEYGGYKPHIGVISGTLRMGELASILQELRALRGGSSGEPVAKKPYGRDESGSCPKCGHRSI